MKKIYGWADHLATFLQVISLVCIGLLGLSLIYFMVDELVAIVRLSTLPSTLDNYYVLLEAVVTFFLFFEFIAMVINILRNGGHISVNFLIGLGITALIRWLIANHGKALDALLISLAVLALIGGTILLTKYLHEEN